MTVTATSPPPRLAHARLAALLLATACSHGSSLAPLGAPGEGGGLADAGDEAASGGGSGSSGAAPDAAPEASPDAPLGAPCGTDQDCQDPDAGAEGSCARASCDLFFGRCTRVPNDAACDDQVFCNGKEICDVNLGCRPGQPVICTMGDACMIGRCDEGTRLCAFAARDADGDGDPDRHCGGGDCDDQNPRVSSKHDEICANGVDDNCNGVVDEQPCVQPAHGTCLDPLLVTAPGSYPLQTAGTTLTTSASCLPAMDPALHNVVAAVTIPPGSNVELDVKVTFPSGADAVAISGMCGVGSTELSCGRSQGSTLGGQIARARVYSLAPGTYPVVVYTDQDIPAQLEVSWGPASTAPTNGTCGTAKVITPGQTELVPLVGAAPNVTSSCGGGGNLVYRVELTEPHDVRVFASTTDGLGRAVVSLRRDPCQGPTDELSCASDNPVTLFARKLGPGPVYLSVESTDESDVSLLVTLEPPTSPPHDESCTSGCPALSPGVDEPFDLKDHTPDVNLCPNAGFVDAAYALDLKSPADALLVLHMPQGAQAALVLARPPCDTKATLVGCAGSNPSPLRLAAHGLDAGPYRAVIQMNSPDPGTLTAFVRDPTPPVFVPFSETCDDAFLIPPTGGYFEGTTLNAGAKYAAGCDEGGTGPAGAPEQMLRLDLPARSRVLFDMQGSDYQTLLDVRSASSCPGDEIVNGCTIGVYPERSFLDLSLDAGSYFVQVDGFNGAAGAWKLDVFVAPLPPGG